MNSNNHNGQQIYNHRNGEMDTCQKSPSEAYDTSSELTRKMLPEHCASTLEESAGGAVEDAGAAHIQQDDIVSTHKQKKEKTFRGYTLDEIRHRKLVNNLKIESAQDRVMLLFSPKVKEEAKTINGTVNNFHNFMRALDIAIVAYNVTRRISKIFRKFSRKK